MIKFSGLVLCRVLQAPRLGRRVSGQSPRYPKEKVLQAWHDLRSLERRGRQLQLLVQFIALPFPIMIIMRPVENLVQILLQSSSGAQWTFPSYTLVTKDKVQPHKSSTHDHAELLCRSNTRCGHCETLKVASASGSGRQRGRSVRGKLKAPSYRTVCSTPEPPPSGAIVTGRPGIWACQCMFAQGQH